MANADQPPLHRLSSTDVTAPSSSGQGPLTIGRIVDAKYEILEHLGTGGMSSVYRARHILTKQLVAIKVLSPMIAAKADSLKRFRQEARAIGRLNHPNIVRLLDFDIVDGLPYLTMDLLEGKSLSQLIKENHGLSPERTILLFTQLCNALSHAHAQGVLHRDLKPSNIIVSQAEDKELAKIVDFGIAKFESDDTQGLTHTGEIFGSPFYMSPEQCQGSPLDARADIYSLGCMLFETLTGSPPFQGSNVYATIRMQIEDAPSSLRARKSSLTGPIADQLQTITFRAMQKDPKDRFQTVDEMLAALEACRKTTGLQSLIAKVIRPTKVKRKWNKQSQMLFVALNACFLLGVGYFTLLVLNSPFVEQVMEAINKPTGTPYQRWLVEMKRGMHHMNNQNYEQSEQDLKNAVVIAKEIPEGTQSIIPLSQLRVLYHIQNRMQDESAIEKQLRSAGRDVKDDETRGLLEQSMTLIPEHPDAHQLDQIHPIIYGSLKLADNYQRENNNHKAAELLRPLLAKVQNGLYEDDPSLVDLKLRLYWIDPKMPIDASLQRMPNLSMDQQSLLHLNLARRNFDSGDMAMAENEIDKALASLRSQPKSLALPLAWADSQFLKGSILMSKDDVEGSIKCYRDSLSTLKAIGSTERVAQLTRHLVRSLIHKGSITSAQSVSNDLLSNINEFLPEVVF